MREEEDAPDERRDAFMEEEEAPRAGHTALSPLFDRLSATPRLWSIIVFVSLIAGAAFALTGFMDAAFVAATLGVVAWFIEMRDRLQRPDVERDDTREERTDMEESENGNE